MICEIDYDILSRGYRLALISEDDTKCITIHFTEHRITEGSRIETTLLKKPDAEAIFKALSTALVKSGFMPESATTAELKATKYHLEDMRNLALT